MLALAQEALDRCGNNADAAQAYLLERLRSDEKLLETLVKSAVEYDTGKVAFIIVGRARARSDGGTVRPSRFGRPMRSCVVNSRT